MKMLGKVAFAPVIASGLLAAGAGTAMAATPRGDTQGFDAEVIKSGTIYGSTQDNKALATALLSNMLDCTSTFTAHWKTQYHCTDISDNVTGWISAGLLGS